MAVNEATIKSGDIELNVFSMGDTEGKPIVLAHGLRDSAKSLFQWELNSLKNTSF